MSIESTELLIYIDNIPPGKQLFEMKKLIHTNLYKKKRKGIYQAELGRKGFLHLVNAGAKGYAREYGSPDTKWHELFTTEARREAAAEYERRFRAEYDSYALEYLVPEKKRRHRPGNPGAKKRTLKKRKPKTVKRGRSRVRVCPVGTEVQTLIFSKAIFTAVTVRIWAKKNNFKTTKVDETLDSYRLRQQDPSRFEPGSFRTISVGSAQAVIGCPQSAAQRKARDQRARAAATKKRMQKKAALKKKAAADKRERAARARKRTAEKKKKASAKKKATAKMRAGLARARKKAAAKKKRTTKKRTTKKRTTKKRTTKKRTTKKRTTKKRTTKKRAAGTMAKRRGKKRSTRPGNPHFKNITAVKRANKAHEKETGRGYWFDRGAMAFFNTRIETMPRSWALVNGSGKLVSSKETQGSFFVTRDRPDSSHPWKWTVRHARPDGRIDTAGPFYYYNSLANAHSGAVRAARGLVHQSGSR